MSPTGLSAAVSRGEGGQGSAVGESGRRLELRVRRDNSADKLAATAVRNRPCRPALLPLRTGPYPRLRRGEEDTGTPPPLGMRLPRAVEEEWLLLGTGCAWCCSPGSPSKGKRAVCRRRWIGRTFFPSSRP